MRYRVTTKIGFADWTFIAIADTPEDVAELVGHRLLEKAYREDEVAGLVLNLSQEDESLPKWSM
jgi:hypothetical protein